MKRLAAALILVSLSAATNPLTDDFRHGLSHWRVEAEAPPRITVQGGVMDIDTPEGLSVWWDEELRGAVAIEYEVMAVSAGGPNDAVSDVNAFWMATDPAARDGSPLARPRSGPLPTTTHSRLTTWASAAIATRPRGCAAMWANRAIVRCGPSMTGPIRLRGSLPIAGCRCALPPMA